MKTVACILAILTIARGPAAFAIGGGWADWEGSTNYNNIGGAGGPTVTVTTATAFMDAVTNKGPLTIQVQGSMTVSGTMGSSDTRIANNKTIVGVGTDAMITGCLATFYATNEIIRNLTLANTGQGDKDPLRTSNYGIHVWVDHCTFISAPDTLLDITHASDLITVTYCVFSNDVEACLVGHSDSNGAQDTGHLNVTWNHNWWTLGATERMPRVRFGKNHVYNNYYSTPTALYNIGVGVYCQILVEADYFDNCGSNTWAQYSTSSSNQGQINWTNTPSVYTDGTTASTWATNSTVFTPPYSYTVDSASTVASTVTNNAGAGRLPIAGFTGSPTTGSPGLSVTFTDTSTGFPTRLEIANRFWAFGDGNTTNTTNSTMSHTYASAGSYTISLTASNIVGTDTLTRSNYIVVSSGTPPPVASFTNNPGSGAAPLSVNFTDTSTGGAPTSWMWAFGDGNTSTAQNPTNTYINPGAYTALLIASNAAGSSGSTAPINVYSPYDWWRHSYFGATNTANGAPGVDVFGTGMDNTNKFLAGFNPNNAAAYLHIISIAPTNTTDFIVIYLGANGDSTYVPGIASRTNVLEFATGTPDGSYSNNFATTGQTNILSGGTGLGIVTNMVDPGGATNAPSRYYRVRVLLP